MSLFSRKIKLVSPITGVVKDITELEDMTFSQKLLGDGVGIDPTDGLILAPSDAKVEQIFETKHAITLDIKGIKLMIHIGMDTVNLKGEGFEVFVREGDHLKQGDKIVKADLEFIKEKGYPTETAVVILDSDNLKDIAKDLGEKEAGKDLILEIKK